MSFSNEFSRNVAAQGCYPRSHTRPFSGNNTRGGNEGNVAKGSVKLCHSELSGFEVVSKDTKQSIENRQESQALVSQDPDSQVHNEEVTRSPNRSLRVVPVQVIEWSPYRVSPSKGTVASKTECLFMQSTPPASSPHTESNFRLPCFTAEKPHMSKPNSSKEDSSGRKTKSKEDSSGQKTESKEESFSALTFQNRRQEGHLLVPRFPNSTTKIDNCKPDISKRCEMQTSILSRSDTSNRLNWSAPGLSQSTIDSTRAGVSNLNGPFQRRKVSSPTRALPACGGPFKLKSLPRKSLRGKKKPAAAETVTPDLKRQKGYATFLPRALSMLVPTDEFTFRCFQDRCSTEPLSAGSSSTDAIRQLEMPLVYGSSSRKSYSPKNKRTWGGDHAEYDSRNKSPRTEDEANPPPIMEAGALLPVRSLSPPIESFSWINRSEDGFSTPTGQMWQDLTTPPFMNSVSS